MVMENVYQQNVETSLNRALPDIAYYLLLGFFLGSILEAVMPSAYEEKDSVALFLEIFAQITLIVFCFMFINSKGGVRNGLVVFILILVGSQPTLFQKINALRIKVFSYSSAKQDVAPPKAPEGATSIDKLPNGKKGSGAGGKTTTVAAPKK